MTLLVGELKLAGSLLFLVRSRVVAEINSSHFIVTQVLKVLLPLGPGDTLDRVALSLLAVKHVSVVANFH